MKRIYLIAAALPILVLGALAQDNTARQVTVFVRSESAVMGPAVKGAPYSAEEVTESTQVLADGTRAYSANQTDGTVTIANLTSHTVEKTLAVVGHPRTVASTLLPLTASPTRSTRPSAPGRSPPS